MLNKKGNVPVTMLVILTMVCFVVALLLFSLYSAQKYKDMEYGYKQVNEYNLNKTSNSFMGIADETVVRAGQKEYWFFGEDKWKVSVSEIIITENG